MQIITQNSLFPTVTPIHWIMLPAGTWDFKGVETVSRETEDAAFHRIRRQAKLYSHARMVSLTPTHRRIHEMEVRLLERHPHYQTNDAERVIAERMHITTQRVKKILNEVSLIYALFISAGMEELLNA